MPEYFDYLCRGTAEVLISGSQRSQCGQGGSTHSLHVCMSAIRGDLVFTAPGTKPGITGIWKVSTGPRNIQTGNVEA